MGIITNGKTTTILGRITIISTTMNIPITTTMAMLSETIGAKSKGGLREESAFHGRTWAAGARIKLGILAATRIVESDADCATMEIVAPAVVQHPSLLTTRTKPWGVIATALVGALGIGGPVVVATITIIATRSE